MQKSKAASVASLPTDERAAFLDGLSANALASMPWLWDLWAIPGHQVAPPGDWRCWLIMGGRGAGKTRAGAEWVRAQVEGPGPLDDGRCRRVALVGDTLDEVRAVMVEGESGLLAVSPPDRRPIFKISQSKLVWPNGAEAQMFSAAKPESLRGPQFDCAWSDELAKWRNCQETWEMLQFCLRLGNDPRQIVTTTPRRNRVLEALIKRPATVMTRAPSEANSANLAPGYLQALILEHGDNSRARQELGGELLTEVEGALWSRALLDGCRVREAPPLDRIVVALDPPVTSGPRSDACGIIVAGVAHGKEGAHDGTVYVLADATVQGLGPTAWCRHAIAIYHAHEADRLVAEVNQGGDLVESMLHAEDANVSYRAVRAAVNKRARAEPVAALYERGRVRHVGAFPALEDEMTAYVSSGKSPDRMDALVWAVFDLVLANKPEARVRLLTR